MSRKNAEKVAARKLQQAHGIPYTEALQRVRDAWRAEEESKLVDTLRKAGER